MTCFFENGPERMFWIHKQLMPPLMSKTEKKRRGGERIKPSQPRSGSVAARIMRTTKNDGLILKAVLLECFPEFLLWWRPCWRKGSTEINRHCPEMSWQHDRMKRKDCTLESPREASPGRKGHWRPLKGIKFELGALPGKETAAESLGVTSEFTGVA